MDPNSETIAFDGRREVIFDILFHTLLMSVILQVLFETKLNSVEKTALSGELNEALRSALSGVKLDDVPDKDLYALRALFEGDFEFNRANSFAITGNRFIVAAIASLATAYFITLSKTCNAKGSMHALMETLKSNMLLLLVVGLLEGLIVYFVILHYIPVPPSEMVDMVYSSLKNIDTPSTSTLPSLPPWIQGVGYGVPLALLAGTVFLVRKAPSLSLSNVVCQGFFVSTVILGVFLTAGVQQEKITIKSTADRVVNQAFLPFLESLSRVDPESEEKIRKRLRSLSPPDMSSQDESAKEMNDEILKKALYICGGAAGAAALSVGFDKLWNRRTPEADPTLASLSTSIVVAASCSMLSEFHFLSHVVANTESISTNQVIRSSIDVLRTRRQQT